MDDMIAIAGAGIVMQKIPTLFLAWFPSLDFYSQMHAYVTSASMLSKRMPIARNLSFIFLHAKS